MSVQLTPFGQVTRKMRIDHTQPLHDMAVHLGVTTGYLSAVERGHRNAPLQWIDILKEAYDLDEEQTAELKQAAEQSRYYDRLDISDLQTVDKQLVERIAKFLHDEPSDTELGRATRDSLEALIQD